MCAKKYGDVWCQAQPPPGYLDLDTLAAALRSRNLTLGSSLRPRTEVGVLFFEFLTEQTAQQISDASRYGHLPLLVILPPQACVTQAEAWTLIEAGAGDVIIWDPQRHHVADVAERLHRWVAIEQMVSQPPVSNNLIGDSPEWRRCKRRLVEVAHFTDASVLLLGESGTGKELAARLVHTLDTRKPKGRLVILDCGAIQPELTGSEFFGHQRGAFTGAVGARAGAFAQAHGGTLFLDEVGELPLELQPRLLRVLQDGSFKPLGSDQWQETAFRLVCATNRDLPLDVGEGRFRPDLFYRIGTVTLHLPSLRERRTDILILAEYFLQQSGRKARGGFSDGVKDYLLSRDYTGNVRDLKQLVQRMADRHVGEGPITLGDIAEEDRPRGDKAPIVWPDLALYQAIESAIQHGVSLRELTRVAADLLVRQAVINENGNLGAAARRLGVTRRALQQRRAGVQESRSALSD